MSALSGQFDATYHTVQRDMFTSGLAAQIGAAAFAVWNAIKFHADFDDGTAFPSIRKIAEATGLGNATVLRAIETLEAAHLLRKVAAGWPSNPARGTRGRSHRYIARERMDVRLGRRVLCTVVVDYIPTQIQKRLRALKKAMDTGEDLPDEVMASVEILPGEGFLWDPEAKVLRAGIPASEVPHETADPAARLTGLVAEAMAGRLHGLPIK